jgi:hypothetical protein
MVKDSASEPFSGIRAKESSRTIVIAKKIAACRSRTSFLTSTLPSEAGALRDPTLFARSGWRSQEKVVSHFLAIYKGRPLVRLPLAGKEEHASPFAGSAHF